MTDQEKLQSVRITNIQRFSLHDGPGIRTTVFLKGCSLHCPWCCNPENINYEKDPWQKEDGTNGIFGEDIPLEDLKEILFSDINFFLDGGGVTFSGGEPLLQIRRYEPLLRELHEEHIHLALETALFVDRQYLEIASRYFDWWYVDMKVMEENSCLRQLGGELQMYLSNLQWLCQNRIPLHIRIPCAHGITDTSENIEEIIRWVKCLPLKEVEIFPIHDLAKGKYMSLKRKLEVDVSQSKKAIETVSVALKNAGINPTVIHI